jgi:hypothetical protein
MASDNQIIVFGYSSKLFRDDIAAEYCDNNKQLHPHELDHMTTIDRFDVRGLLEFPIDFKKATNPTTKALLDEKELLHEIRFGDINIVDQHGKTVFG